MDATVTVPKWGIQEGGLTEIIDKNDAAIAASAYSKSVSVDLSTVFSTASEKQSGEILYMNLYASEVGTGAVLATAGKMYVFDADPAVEAAAIVLAAAGAEHKTCLGFVHFASTDWDSDANGGIARKVCAIPFHRALHCGLCLGRTQNLQQ